MNADLTLNALQFKQNWNGPDGSLRTETSQGPNLPETLAIRNRDYNDPKYKIVGVQTNVLLEKFVALADASVAPIKVSLTVYVPSDVNITSALVTAAVGRLVNLIHGATNTDGLGLAANIFVNKEQ